MAKGYTPGADGTPYQTPDTEERFTGILPQLLNPIDETEANRLLNDSAFVMQQKFNGRRMLIRKQEAAIHGINKKGLLIGLPESVFQDINALPGNFILDGECIGDVFHAFDLLVVNGGDSRSLPYRKRLTALMNLLASAQHRFIKYANTAYSPEGKQDFLRKLQREQQEGVVFKRLDAPYTPDRPNSGGPQLKHKFYATASFIVWKVNTKRSVCLALWGTSRAHPPTSPAVQVTAGNVTIPPNHHIPKVGSVVEVRYLYAFKESGVIYQPVYLGLRADIDPSECRVEQLKYKPV